MLTQLFPYFLMFILCGGILAGTYRALGGLKIPAWVWRVVLVAVILRFGAGVLWYVGLPQWGYDTDVQNAGYVMEDAFQRDTAAWELSQANEPLFRAFTAYNGADQYGGMLFISAFVYRYLGGNTHQPLLMVMLAATVSALVVVAGYVFARDIFDERVAKWSAWGLALYPEAVLLGSSQMREAFFMPLVAFGIFAFIQFLRTRRRVLLLWLVLLFVVMFPISPPLTAVWVVILVLITLFREDWLRNWRLWAGLGGALGLIVAGLWLGWDFIAPRFPRENFSSPVELLSFWLQWTTRWQFSLTADASGWLQKVLAVIPDALDQPFIVGYGITRPLLPAALVASGAWFWRIIVVWRALGWTILLGLLAYTPFRMLQVKERTRLWTGLLLAVWAGIVFASIWGGGDMWENPRYRVVFIGLQIPLAAWAVISYLRQPDRWLLRAAVVVGIMLAYFLPWYLRRYTPLIWPVVDLFKLITLGGMTGALYLLWDWAGENP